MIKKSYAQGSIPNRSHFQVTLNFKSLGTLGGGDSGVNHMPGVRFWTGHTFRYHLIQGDQELLRYQFQEQLNERRSAWDSSGTTFRYHLILRDWGLLMDDEQRITWMAGLFIHFFFHNDYITGAHNRRKRNWHEFAFNGAKPLLVALLSGAPARERAKALLVFLISSGAHGQSRGTFRPKAS